MSSPPRGARQGFPHRDGAKLAVRSDLARALRSLGPGAELLRVKAIKSDGHVVMHALEIKNRGVRRKLVLRRYIDRVSGSCDGIEVDPVWDVVDACDWDRGN